MKGAKGFFFYKYFALDGGDLAFAKENSRATLFSLDTCSVSRGDMTLDCKDEGGQKGKTNDKSASSNSNLSITGHISISKGIKRKTTHRKHTTGITAVSCQIDLIVPSWAMANQPTASANVRLRLDPIGSRTHASA